MFDPGTPTCSPAFSATPWPLDRCCRIEVTPIGPLAYRRSVWQMSVLSDIVPKLAVLPGVEAVVLGGSRARGADRPGSEWDLGVYYRGSFDSARLDGRGYPGHLAQPGEWGRLANGGAWLSVQGQPVDVLLRDLDQIEVWWAEAREGRFEIDNVEGHLAGLPTYVPVGEIALCRPLFGRLPSVWFPEELRAGAGYRWRWCAAFSLFYAEQYSAHAEVATCVGMLVRAAQAAHGIRADRGEWTLNEKGLLLAAGLTDANVIVSDVGLGAMRAVQKMRDLLDPPDLGELSVHP
jgi:predicted nucleotidyltransferase